MERFTAYRYASLVDVRNVLVRFVMSHNYLQYIDIQGANLSIQSDFNVVRDAYCESLFLLRLHSLLVDVET